MIKVADVSRGVIRDGMPEELDLGVWTAVSNMRTSLGYVERCGGFEVLYTAPSVTPYYITTFQTATKNYVVHAGLATAFVDDGTTRTEITGTAPTGAIDDRWTGGTLAGYLVMNNGVDLPQTWDGNTANNLTALSAWDTNHRAKFVRCWRNYIFAGDITETATRYPYRFRWSNAAEPGTLPTAYAAAAGNDAGEVDIAETPDLLIDALPLGEMLVVYKQRSMFAVRWIGGNQVFQIDRLPGEYGMLARGCAAQTPMGHVVMSVGDVILHAGAGVRSIADGRVRREIFDNLNTSNPSRSFVVTNLQKSEVWVCYPTGAAAACTKAAIWNWNTDTWTFRDLPNATYGVSGQANNSDTETWTTTTPTWTTVTRTWAMGVYAAQETRLLMCHTTPYLSVVDNGQTDLGSTYTASAERTGMHLDAPDKRKLCRGLWPRIDGANGAQISVSVGAAEAPDSSPVYQAAQTFVVGTSNKIDALVSGRYLAVKFESESQARWRLRGFELDVAPLGRF